MFGSVKKFLRDVRGAFAMQFALMAVPLCVCTGLAIDGGRAFLAHYELASALDAAALAVGSNYVDGADLNAMARLYVERNFRTDHDGPITLNLDSTDDVVTLSGEVRINTYFMPLVGQPYVDVSAESEVRRGGANVEVALALDVTGSMSGSKIDALKVAAKDLIDQVVNDNQTPYFSKVAIAPWTTNIHLGSYADAIRGPVTGPTDITGAAWRDGTAHSLIANTGWRVGGVGRTVSAASWRNGSAFTVSSITKLTGPARIRVTTSSNHGYANGDTVYISGANGSYTGLNGGIFKVADRTTTSPYTYTLYNVGTTTYTTPPAGSTNSTAGASQRCFDTVCDVRVTTSAVHGFAANDFVRITGVSGMTQLNNGTNQSWVIKAAPSTTTFTVVGLTGPSTSNWTSGGTASECYNAECRFVVNATAHGFSNGDYVYVNGATVSGSGTSMNNSSNTWTIANVTTNSFQLPNSGYSYRDWTSGGTASECFNAACQMRITSTNHGLSSGGYVQILSVGGFTSVNNTSNASYQVASPSTNSFYLSTFGPTLSTSQTYTSNTGQAFCLAAGCQKYRYTSRAGSVQIRDISNCATERVGADAHTDVAPSTSYIGRDYPGLSNNAGCNTANNIQPLTANKTTLKDNIDDLSTDGSTAGQIGAEWAWYMLAPDWDYLWPDTENEPLPYAAKELAKVAVLMTDGEFNTAHCNGVSSNSYSIVDDTDRINCDPADAPFVQAQKTCTAMKAAGVMVYTVGFELPLGGAEETFMKTCATSTAHAYMADDADALKRAFKSIAREISKLRISK